MKVRSRINSGLLKIYGPIVGFVSLITSVSYWILTDILMLELADVIGAGVLFISIGIGWLWWSVKIVKWKCAAFAGLSFEEGFELYTQAIGVGLIWPKGHIFNKTEIWSRQDRIRWGRLDPDVQLLFSDPS